MYLRRPTFSMVSLVMTFSSSAAIGDGGLDGGAGNVAVTEGNLLIHDRKNAAGVRIHGDHGAVVAAQRFDSGLRARLGSSNVGSSALTESA